MNIEKILFSIRKSKILVKEKYKFKEQLNKKNVIEMSDEAPIVIKNEKNSQ